MEAIPKAEGHNPFLHLLEEDHSGGRGWAETWWMSRGLSGGLIVFVPGFGNGVHVGPCNMVPDQGMRGA